MKKLLFIISFFIIKETKAQIITTVVGNGTVGFSGDGGQATAAELASPIQLKYNATGDLYIVDAVNNAIRKVTAAGIITTVAGGNATQGFSGDGGQATAAELGYPEAVTFDAAGNLYIGDGNNGRTRKVNSAGIITTIAGGGTAGLGDGGQATDATLDPHGLAFDAAGNLYVADWNNSRIRKINTAGIITTVAGNGSNGFSGDGGQATAAELFYPGDVIIDAAGNLYISDEANVRIRKVSTSGIITTIAGNGTQGYSGDGGQAINAELYQPTGIALDASGNLYIADQLSNRIRKVSTSGIITTIAGDGTRSYSGDGGQATAAELNYPNGVTLDAVGNIYIADTDNERIRIITSGGATGPQLCFSNAINFANANQPNRGCSADFNGDNFMDLAIIYPGSNCISILLGIGTGSFGSATNYTVGTAPLFITSNDFNGDGFKDLATTIPGSYYLCIMLGNGIGGFSSGSYFYAGTNLTEVISADFNKDGKIDIVIANSSANNVSILLGTGTGSFGFPSFFPGGIRPTYITHGDYNGDTNLDLVVSNLTSDSISVLEGDGAGNFNVSGSFSVGVGSQPRSIVTADLNGDTKLDLAVACFGSNQVSVLLGNGLGSFSSPTNFLVGNLPVAAICSDFDKDGNLDLATTNFSSNNISILLGNGLGNFSSAVNFSTGTNPNSLISADFNGDSFVDLVTTNQSSNNLSILLNCTTAGTTNISTYNSKNLMFNIYPNPFIDQTAINYTLANPSYVTVTIYTPEGMQVATLEEKIETAGQHTLNWDTKSLASGIYFCKIKCNEGEKVLKLIKVE